jgi:hypothetical protein
VAALRGMPDISPSGLPRRVTSPELHGLVAAPIPLAASYASGLILVAILALMVGQ